MEFVQVMEFQTSQLDQVKALDQRWRAETEGKRTATSMMITQDRDRPGTYVWIIGFPSYEAAQQNNDLPETQAIAEAMAKATDGPTSFRNLDVMEKTDL
jgi:quinol monooxygenase YgiN